MSKRKMRRTKIVCTIGPASADPEMLFRLIKTGLDVARLNFSHGSHESHLKNIINLRNAALEAGREIGILLDLAGPKIRLGAIPDPGISLLPGSEIWLADEKSLEEGDIPVNYPHLADDLMVDDRILLADGGLELCVVEKLNKRLLCKVVVGGVLTSHKGVNLPMSNLRVPTFTPKDKKDLLFGLKHSVDMVALSFVRHENDLAPLKKIIAKENEPPLLLAKIEKPEALDRLPQILKEVDGVMVARGDLGVEMSLAEIPVIQKRVIGAARAAGKSVITATQMLGSMVSSPRPSRAEVTDVANAVLDGTDAVMLSEETAIGQYPVQAVRYLDKICLATEPSMESSLYLTDGLKGVSESIIQPTPAAISRAVITLANELEPAMIVAATSSGSTARLISRFRPVWPVLGMSPSIGTCRKLCLSWGILPVLVPVCKSVDEMLDIVHDWAIKNDRAKPGDRIIVTAGVPIHVPGSTNLIKVIKIEEPERGKTGKKTKKKKD